MSEETLKKILLTNGYTQQIDKEAVYDYIQKLKSQLEEWKQHLIIAKEMLDLQGSDGNYNYDSYMLGLYNGMEYIIAFFETREPNFKNGKDIEFLNDKNKNQELKKQLSNSHQIKNQQKEFIKFLENEKDRLARETSHIYEDEIGKVRLVNEDVFNEINKILSKYKEIIGGKE